MAAPNLRELLRKAKRLGIEVEDRRGTGELVLRHSAAGFVVCSSQRRDSPRAVIAFVRTVERAEKEATG